MMPSARYDSKVQPTRKFPKADCKLLDYFCPMIVGLISDTHGLLRPEALTALAGVDMILHAGDVGGADVLAGLQAIAPVLAVRGNIDAATDWPLTVWATVEQVKILMIHQLDHLSDMMLETAPTFVVYGHSHKPALHEAASIHYLNPGAAGNKRFSLPISVARLHVDGASWRVEFINLLDKRPLP
jgi:uncharacterized protein